MDNRKIIFECKVGSHLYGTNRPESDEDYMGVFLPSQNDILGLGNPPSEWSMDEKKSKGDKNQAGDIDRKYYSLQKFLNLLIQGQSGPIEMIFSPPEMWTMPLTTEWDRILQNRNLFLSSNSIQPFLGFAKAQAIKSTIKGENLKQIRSLINSMQMAFDTFPALRYSSVEKHTYPGASPEDYIFFKQNVKSELVEYRPGVSVRSLVIAGRKFEFTQKLKNVHDKLKELERKYGSRSEATLLQGFDYKSLMHAYRLILEAEELKKTGHLTLPRRIEEAIFLKSIRSGEYKYTLNGLGYADELEQMIEYVKTLKSVLPDRIDVGKINKLCIELMHNHLFGGL